MEKLNLHGITLLGYAQGGLEADFIG